MPHANNRIRLRFLERLVEIRCQIHRAAFKPELEVFPLGQITKNLLQKLETKGKSHFLTYLLPYDVLRWQRTVHVEINLGLSAKNNADNQSQKEKYPQNPLQFKSLPRLRFAGI